MEIPKRRLNTGGRSARNPAYLEFIRVLRRTKSREEAQKILGVSFHTINWLLRSIGEKVWPLEQCIDKVGRSGRLAELWVKRQTEFKVIEDMYEVEGSHAKYDLVIEKYGKVNVKHSALLLRKQKGCSSVYLTWSSGSGKLFKNCDFVFFVACDEKKEYVLAIFIIPVEELKDKKCITIFSNPIRGYYSKFLFKEFKEKESRIVEEKE